MHHQSAVGRRTLAGPVFSDAGGVTEHQAELTLPAVALWTSLIRKCGYRRSSCALMRELASNYSVSVFDWGLPQSYEASYRALPQGPAMSMGYEFLDFVPTLEVFVAEVDGGLAFARRVGIEQMDRWLGACWWLKGMLRGENSDATSDAVPVDRYADNPTARFSAHFTRAIAAAIYDDPATLKRRTAAAMQALLYVPGNYVTAVARLLGAWPWPRTPEALRLTSVPERSLNWTI